MICVLIRVHDRMSDLEVCVEVIRRHWRLDDCYLLVVSNGRSRGFGVPESVRSRVDCVLEIEESAGHFAGNSRLLRAGIQAVPDECTWTILLEADTWIFGDAVLRRYVRRLEREGKVWASAEWVEKVYSLALDVAIVETAFAKRHPRLFEFSEPPGPEAWVYDQLRRAGQEPIYIRENMPVHVPALMRRFYNRFGGRFRTFTRARMVTHHIEDLGSGLEEKKRIANQVLGRLEFDVQGANDIARRHRMLRLFEGIRPLVPRSTWFRRKQWKTVPPQTESRG
ncbi:MAG: hypothetical protein ACE5G2_04385 [Candidatus Krumholzibacteriia bacterium]